MIGHITFSLGHGIIFKNIKMNCLPKPNAKNAWNTYQNDKVCKLRLLSITYLIYTIINRLIELLFTFRGVYE